LYVTLKHQKSNQKLCWWIISTQGIIHPVVSASATSWFIIYIISFIAYKSF
jgi:hypothetical protein